MRKTVIAGLALFMAALCQAGLPSVQSIEKVNLPAGMTVSMATISPNGDYAVVSSLSGTGLQRVDLTTGEVTEISQNASPLSVEISADGKDVIYREASYDKDHRRFVTLKSFNAERGESKTLVDRTRSMRKVKADYAGRASLSIEYGKLYVTTPAGKTYEIAPLGKECNSYLWPTLSPAGTKVLAFGVGTGAFVCDLEGNNVKTLGMYRAPQWLDNETVVAMDDYDNGVVTVKSTIMALSADGKEKAALTGDDVVAVFPTPATGKVAFTTPTGEMYIINLK